MTKPKIEEFIPPGWYAAMDEDGEVLICKILPTKFESFWAVPSDVDENAETQISPEHAAMFDLSIFGDDWEKSLFQKPPELQPCPVCGGKPYKRGSTYQCENYECQVWGPINDNDGSKWNRLRYEAE